MRAFSILYHGLDTLRDLTIRSIIAYWNRAQGLMIVCVVPHNTNNMSHSYLAWVILFYYGLALATLNQCLPEWFRGTWTILLQSRHKCILQTAINKLVNKLQQKYLTNCGCIPSGTMYNGSYRETSNIRRTLVGNKIVDHSDVVGASPVGAAPTTSSFST